MVSDTQEPSSFESGTRSATDSGQSEIQKLWTALTLLRTDYEALVVRLESLRSHVESRFPEPKQNCAKCGRLVTISIAGKPPTKCQWCQAAL